MVGVLLAGLTRLGGNAYIAKRLIAMLATHAPGRSALRTACARWRAQATGLSDDADASKAAAVQWTISRLWQQGEALPLNRALAQENDADTFALTKLDVCRACLPNIEGCLTLVMLVRARSGRAGNAGSVHRGGYCPQCSGGL